MHRLVIIEDQTAIREMLAEILGLDKELQAGRPVRRGPRGPADVPRAKPDLVVLDAKLPGLNGVELLRRLAKKLPTVRVLVFSGP
jgi:DNA-binding NarL/FixJ family response regulator